jgi:hypothetical protein
VKTFVNINPLLLFKGEEEREKEGRGGKYFD